MLSRAGGLCNRLARRRRPALLLAPALTTLGLMGCGSSSPKVSSGTPRSLGTSASSTTLTSTSTSASPEATASAGSRAQVSASAGGVSATMHGSTHEPKVGQRWPFSLTVTSAGRPARATVTYEYVFGGQVVARRASHSFDGHFADWIEWPSSAVDYPLEFRAAIASEGATINLDYPVRVGR